MIALSLVALAALVWILVEHDRLDRFLVRHPPPVPPPARFPSLTMVRPIRGVDVGAAENLRALLDSDYPGRIEVLFVLDDASDPAVPLVRAAIAERPNVDARVLFAGAPPPGRTGKLHAMSLAVRASSGELVGFSDSDTRVDRDLVRALVERLLANERAGDVFAPALADAPPRTAGDVGYALMLNVWYGALAVAAAGPAHELPFIMGQLMIFRREALAAIGGVECAEGQLVDDMYLGQRMVAAGWHNLMSERSLRIVTGDMSWRDFLRLMRRWVLFSRAGLPSRFKRPAWLRGVAISTALVAGALALASAQYLAAAIALLALVVACASDLALHRRLGGAPVPPRFAWMTLAIVLLSPWVLASMLVDHRVDWRGRDYALDGGSLDAPIAGTAVAERRHRRNA